MSGSLRIQRGGDGDPVLLLIHGLGATGDVWQGLHELLPGRWPGRWITPDLPGHGGSAPLPAYSFGALARAVAGAVPATGRLVVIGHSLGGVVALSLASGTFGVEPAAVLGLGIKVEWTDDDLARARSLASRSNPVYSTRTEAAERYLKVAGLTGLVGPDQIGTAALVQAEAGWTLAFDPAAFAVGAPDMTALVQAAQGTVVLAAGERDPMCSEGSLRRLVPDPVILAGLGHNAQVENPAALLVILARL